MLLNTREFPLPTSSLQPFPLLCMLLMSLFAFSSDKCVYLPCSKQTDLFSKFGLQAVTYSHLPQQSRQSCFKQATKAYMHSSF
jgi:hypothetical protein